MTTSSVVGPNSGKQSCHLGHALNAKAAATARVNMKENPAYKWVKAPATKSKVLPKKPKSVQKGVRNLPTAAGADEMAPQGLA